MITTLFSHIGLLILATGLNLQRRRSLKQKTVISASSNLWHGFSLRLTKPGCHYNRFVPFRFPNYSASAALLFPSIVDWTSR
jgi:hypothetical protein